MLDTNRAIVKAFLTVLIAIFLPACQNASRLSVAEYRLTKDGGSMCADNADCEEWEVCVWGSCTDQGSGYCDEDADCEEGYVCMAGYCEEDYYDYCTTDADCPDGFVCMYGYCEEDYYDCTTDEDCGPGYVCLDGYCEEDYVDCYDDMDCYPGEICVDGYCEWNGGDECYDDLDCQPGQTCEDGFCVGGVQPCLDDSQCPQGQTCQNGTCVDDGQGCATNDDCPQGQICDPDSFTCVDDPTGCDPPCQAGYTCQNGSCLEDSGCEDECSPPGGTQCADENGTLTCGDFDDDACYELGDPTPCDAGEVCQSFSSGSGACRSCGGKWDPCCAGEVCNGELVCDNGTCNDAGSGCTDECSMFSGARVCSDDSSRGEGYLECGQHDQDSCLEYGPFVACQPGQVCQGGRCVADCGDDCDPPADQLTRCEDDYSWSECLDPVGETCVVWGEPQACAEGTRCSDGQCLACDFLDICDGIDNDCDGDIDEDDDCTGYAAAGCSCGIRTAGRSRTSPGSGLLLLVVVALVARRRMNETG